MRVFAVVLLIGAAVAVASIGKFRARAEVMGDNLASRIDSFLGSMEVKRKEIEHGIHGLQDGLDALRKSKVKAQVQHDQLVQRMDPLQRRVDGIDNALKTLRGKLTSSSSTEIGGKSYKPEQLQSLARQLLDDRQRSATVLEGFRKSQAQLADVVESLEGKQSTYEQRLASVQSQLTLIDSKRTTLVATKQAAIAMDGSASSLAGKVDELENKVGDLYADVEAELQSESARHQGAGALAESKIDAVIAAVEDPSDLIARIDRTIDAAGKLGDEVASSKPNLDPLATDIE